MGWFWSLSIECGDESTAAAVGAGLEPLCAADPAMSLRAFDDHEGHRWVSVFVGESNAPEPSGELVADLYARLRTASGYRYALFGFEVDELRTLGELGEGTSDLEGLVLADGLWSDLGEPGGFVAFAPGCRWRPYASDREQSSVLPLPAIRPGAAPGGRPGPPGGARGAGGSGR